MIIILKECEKTDMHPDLARDLKKVVEHESEDNTNFNRCSCYSHQRISTRTGWDGNKRSSGDHPNYCIIEIG